MAYHTAQIKYWNKILRCAIKLYLVITFFSTKSLPLQKINKVQANDITTHCFKKPTESYLSGIVENCTGFTLLHEKGFTNLLRCFSFFGGNSFQFQISKEKKWSIINPTDIHNKAYSRQNYKRFSLQIY